MKNIIPKTKRNKIFIIACEDKNTKEPMPMLAKGEVGVSMGRMFGVCKDENAIRVEDTWRVTDLDTGLLVCTARTRKDAVAQTPDRMLKVMDLLRTDPEAREMASKGQNVIREALRKMYLGCMIEEGDDTKYLHTGMLPFKATECRHADPDQKDAKVFKLDQVQVFLEDNGNWWDIEACGYNKQYQRIA